MKGSLHCTETVGTRTGGEKVSPVREAVTSIGHGGTRKTKFGWLVCRGMTMPPGGVGIWCKRQHQSPNIVAGACASRGGLLYCVVNATPSRG